MRALSFAVLTLVSAVGCSDYTLNGDGRGERPRRDDDDIPVDGPQPEIKVDPMVLSFGSRQVDCPSDPKVITVSNVGQATLEVDDLRLAGTGSNAFQLDGAPRDLEPGESFTFDLGFTAAAMVTYNVRVEVDSNDPTSRTTTVEVTGRGAENTTNEEIFVQPDVSAVDVLWVVDNSCSMSDIQATLGDKFRSFLQSFNDMGIGYQIGVTSTDTFDPAQSGRLLGPKKVMTNADPDVLDLFARATDLGTSGSGDEKGLDAAYLALTDPLISGENAGLIRDEAVLAVVVISDEEDASQISPADFSRWLNNFKGDPERTSLSAVVGDVQSSSIAMGCSSTGFPPVTAEQGRRYVEVQRATEGTFQSICDSDFDQVLAYLGYGASGLKFEFPLEKTPTSIGGIKVTVDGVEIPRHPTNGWFYDSASNTVKFSRRAVPGPSTTILITYPVADDC